MRVHARSVDPEDRLRHERRVQIVPQRHVLHHEPEGADVVRRRQHIVVAEVDLVLAGGDFVMRGLDVEPHRLEREHDLAAHVLALIDRRQVEVAARVVRLGGRLAVAPLEQEELGLGPRVHREAALGGQRDHALQRGARAAGERLAVGPVDVADHPRHLLAARVAPREDREGVEVGPQVHVRLLDADEALDRRAVEHDLAVQRVLELAVGDLDVLDRPEDVGELQAEELHLLALRRARGCGPSRRPARDPRWDGLRRHAASRSLTATATRKYWPAARIMPAAQAVRGCLKRAKCTSNSCAAARAGQGPANLPRQPRLIERHARWKRPMALEGGTRYAEVSRSRAGLTLASGVIAAAAGSGQTPA